MSYINMNSSNKIDIISKLSELMDAGYINASLGRSENGLYYLDATDAHDEPAAEIEPE